MMWVETQFVIFTGRRWRNTGGCQHHQEMEHWSKHASTPLQPEHVVMVLHWSCQRNFAVVFTVFLKGPLDNSAY